MTQSQACASRYTGKERDTESGLDYFGARYYASGQGRWMSPDWADKPEAVPYSDLADFQSLNLYGYVRNNPLTRADADGHEEDSWVSRAVAFVGGIGRGATQSTFPMSGLGPTSGDSSASLAGQLVGSGIAGIIGTETTLTGGGMVVGGAAAAPVSGGASLSVSAEGVAVAGAGVVVAKGALTNANAVSATMAMKGSPSSNPMTGQPGSTSQTKQPDGSPKQVREYGADGHPKTDVDHGHDHGQGDPHAHDWGRPANGGPPTHTDRGPGRPVKPNDPKPQ